MTPSPVTRNGNPATGLCRWLDFDRKHGNCGGSLIQFQAGAGPSNAVPFPIAKVLYMTDIGTSDRRGNHAHYRTREIVVCLEGACTIDLQDGKGRSESVRLDRPDRVVELPPHVWRVLRDFAPGTKLLALADTPYDEADYIRDYDRFLSEARRWEGLL